jgi:uncharacterized protein
MAIIKFGLEALEGAQAVPVPVPVGTPVPAVRTRGYPSGANQHTKPGVWECSPGKFVRQIKQAEFSYFVEGSCTFTPDDGSPTIEITAGDAVFFPPNSLGTWNILTRCRKFFLVFDETPTT